MQFNAKEAGKELHPNLEAQVMEDTEADGEKGQGRGERRAGYSWLGWVGPYLPQHIPPPQTTVQRLLAGVATPVVKKCELCPQLWWWALEAVPTSRGTCTLWVPEWAMCGITRKKKTQRAKANWLPVRPLGSKSG